MRNPNSSSLFLRLRRLRYSFVAFTCLTLCLVVMALISQIGMLDMTDWNLLIRNTPLARNFSHVKPDSDENQNQLKKLQLSLAEMETRVKESVTFLPLKDQHFEATADQGNTWFMSRFQDVEDGGDLGNLYFPSEASKGRVLCVLGRDASDGTRNGYGLAWLEQLPSNSTLLPGLTFISDNYYDYKNPWHSLTSLIPFVWWHISHGCVSPARFVLYHWGELVNEMGTWISDIMHASLGHKVPVDDLNYSNSGPVCFEKSLVYRRGIGNMPPDKRMDLFDLIRCKARNYCEVHTGDEISEGIPVFNFTLLKRSGSRSFKNESMVVSIFQKECEKVTGCRFRVVGANNLSFCDQVNLMSSTQVLATVHGAQLANMIFMSRGSHIMEMFPKGWLELAGPGQRVFQWLADWTGMKHEGTWHDTVGPTCPDPEKGDLHCFFFYKDGQVGYNQTFMSRWSSDVLSKIQTSTATTTATSTVTGSDTCPC